jgi:hypothetical protein
MAASQSAPPKHSWSKLSAALDTLHRIRAKQALWMKFLPYQIGRRHVLNMHPVYSVRLTAFLAGKPLSKTLKKVGWMYFLRDNRKGLACAEVSIVSGRHKNARLMEGPFVGKTLRLIDKSKHDPRIGRRRYELASLRLESMHIFCLWFKVSDRVEYFIPVTSSSAVLREGEWVSRKELIRALRTEGHRVRTAQQRMVRLLKAHQS